MNEGNISRCPTNYNDILSATAEAGFTMASDMLICSLLRTLAASKRGAKFLELGTGTGLSTSWILDGMDTTSSLISVDNDPNVLAIAKQYLGTDSRLNLVEADGAEWIEANRESSFDFVFADTWHGKYLLLDEVLDMVVPGGIYFIDDMLPQSNWPEGHAEKVTALISYLDTRTDFVVTKQCWGSGAVIMVKV
jgi:predicted O-methyltransferase YrrM